LDLDNLHDSEFEDCIDEDNEVSLKPKIAAQASADDSGFPMPDLP